MLSRKAAMVVQKPAWDGEEELVYTHQGMFAVPKSSQSCAVPELRLAWSSALHEAAAQPA